MLDASVRYPWYMSGRCLDTARDGQWHAVGFMKASMSSGLVWFYRDHRELADDMACAVDCLIGAGSAIVTEGRFGRRRCPAGHRPFELNVGPAAALLIFDSPVLLEARGRLKPYTRTS